MTKILGVRVTSYEEDKEEKPLTKDAFEEVLKKISRPLNERRQRKERNIGVLVFAVIVSE